MQTLGLTAVVLIALAGLTALAIRHRGPGLDRSLGRQILLGSAMGLVGLFVVMVLSTDAIPDEIEGPLMVVIVGLVTILLIAVAWRRGGFDGR
jgi:peptidoglycan/LPS O-acetylase OafA/YrhL